MLFRSLPGVGGANRGVHQGAECRNGDGGHRGRWRQCARRVHGAIAPRCGNFAPRIGGLCGIIGIERDAVNLIDAKYWLEVWCDGRVTQSYLLPYVQSYHVQLGPSVAFRHTLGATPMRWHSGYKNVPITVSGVSGQGERLGMDAGGVPPFAERVHHMGRFR